MATPEHVGRQAETVTGNGAENDAGLGPAPSTLSGVLAGLRSLGAQATPVQVNLWLVFAWQWVRGNARDPAEAAGRLGALTQAVAADAQLQAAWRAWWQQFVARVDATPLLADLGFAPRPAFLSELARRMWRKVLPGSPQTRDMAELFEVLEPDVFDARWLRAVDAACLQRLQSLCDCVATPVPGAVVASDVVAPPGVGGMQAVLLDALAINAGQIQAIGFSHEVRTRLADEAWAQRTFHDLPQRVEQLGAALRAPVATDRVALSQAAAQALRQQLDACRLATQAVYTHLQDHGISVGIVFSLRQMRQRILRMKALLDVLLTAQPQQALVNLLAQLALDAREARSVRALIASSSHLTAARVAERNAETGEHYITRTRPEYRAMVWAALGGGAVIGFTTWVKFAVTALDLSPFWEGLAAGSNYALSFVVVMLLHWTVATKQPAMTAPAMAAKLKAMDGDAGLDAFVDEVANLLRSQTAAIVGNLVGVVPVVLAIGAGLWLLHGGSMMGEAKAHHVLHSMHLLGPTAAFAAFTGVLLFASSIVAGWVENWFVLNRMDSALRYHPRVTRWLGPQRAGRWAEYWRQNISGYTANISLGLLLGLVPAVAEFFGLGLEVRHVTLSAGQVAAAAAALGTGVFAHPEFWWAVAGVLLIGPINLGVSFYCALRLALTAQGVTGLNRSRIRAAIWQRVRARPLSFLLPER